MKAQALAAVLVVAVVASAAVGYYLGSSNEHTLTSIFTSTTTYTASSPTVQTTTITTCYITGSGIIEVHVSPTLETEPGVVLNSTLTGGCAGVRSVVVDNFSQAEQGGWYAPILPQGWVTAGEFTFHIRQPTRTYSFSVGVAPLLDTCVSLSVPSGAVEIWTVSNPGPTGYACASAGNYTTETTTAAIS
jgi:hypothetical protein